MEESLSRDIFKSNNCNLKKDYQCQISTQNIYLSCNNFITKSYPGFRMLKLRQNFKYINWILFYQNKGNWSNRLAITINLIKQASANMYVKNLYLHATTLLNSIHTFNSINNNYLTNASQVNVFHIWSSKM